jgi:pentatricopeptide repeat protein
VEPGAGHSAHARAHAHYETGDHEAGLAWMDSWVTGDGASIDETRIAALVRAGRLDEARELLDARLDRRHSPRDRGWLGQADLVT